MTRYILIYCLLLLAPDISAAQGLIVRSGEHGSFSRLVIPFPQGTEWGIEQEGNSITITPNVGDYQYDLREVFRYIPKIRISSIIQAAGSQGLSIETTGVTHLNAFQLKNGTVVIDVIDGPASSSLSLIPNISDYPSYSYVDTHSRDKLSDRNFNSKNNLDSYLPFTSPKVTRILNAERDLVEDLSRATSQGLFNVNVTRPARQYNMPILGADQVTDKSKLEMAIFSQSVIDREFGKTDEQSRVLISENRCLSDRMFDLQAWVTAAPPTEQISVAREKLIGEFDEVDTHAVLELARIYLGLGLGAEARAILLAFGVDSPSAGILKYIADIIDEKIQKNHLDQFSLKKMTSCDGKVALWAILGSLESPRIDEVNLPAVQSAFSALPPSVSLIVAPRLIDKFLSMGARDAAQTISNVLDRSATDSDGVPSVIRAELSLAHGDAASAEALSQTISMSNQISAARAVIVAINARLEQGRAVNKEATENAAALVEQLGDSTEGIELRRGAALGEGSVGAFDKAFGFLESWPDKVNENLFYKTKIDLYRQLAEIPDEAIFLRQVISRIPDIFASELPLDIQVKISNRLSDSGFSREAKAVLSDATKSTDSGLLALAHAALVDRDASAALSHLEGMNGKIAVKMRAQALAKLGEHASAAKIFASSGEVKVAGKEAWLSGDWPLVEQLGSDIHRKALNVLVMPKDLNPLDDQYSGLIQRSRELIKHSAEERRTMEVLLERLTE